MPDYQRTERIVRWYQNLTPQGRTGAVTAYAAKMKISLSEAEAAIQDILSGKTDADIAQLEELRAASEEKAILLRHAAQALQSAMAQPWMLALEMQFLTMRVTGMPRLRPSTMSPEIAHEQLAALKQAEAYSWAADTAKSVLMASESIPQDSVLASNALPGHAGWWWFNQPPLNEGVCALLWIVEGNEVQFTAYDKDELHVPLPIASWSWSLDTPPTWNQPQDIVFQLSRFFIAACAWLQQRVVVTSPGHVERHRRKQLSREHGGMSVVQSVQVIQLRRREVTTHEKSDGEPVEWSCRWIVSGHWRNQYYPSLGAKKLIYIMPFVKGPDDKPMKQITARVYDVSR